MAHRAVGAGLTVLALSLQLAHAGPACTGTDAKARPVPPALAQSVVAAFGVRMTPADAVRSGFVRCENGRVLACLTGANLDCGKGDPARTNPGAEQWCRSHPDAEFVPAFASGHDTIYAWRCRGAQAVIERQIEQLDAEGFVAENWRELR